MHPSGKESPENASAINGRGIAIGVGSYDGESAFAVGFQIQGEQASFKVGVKSSGGETAPPQAWASTSSS